MNLCPLVVAIMVVAPAAVATPTEYSVDTASSTLRYTISHPFHRVVGVSRAVVGKATYDAEAGGSVQIAAPVKSFDTGNANRDAHALEVVAAHRNPDASFDAKLPPKLPDTGSATVDGTVSLRGVSNQVKVDLQIERSGNRIVVKASFVTSLSAHKAERPSLMFLSVDDELKVEADIAFVAAN